MVFVVCLPRYMYITSPFQDYGVCRIVVPFKVIVSRALPPPPYAYRATFFHRKCNSLRPLAVPFRSIIFM